MNPTGINVWGFLCYVLLYLGKKEKNECIGGGYREEEKVVRCYRESEREGERERGKERERER
jgi:hypothetical protein